MLDLVVCIIFVRFVIWVGFLVCWINLIIVNNLKIVLEVNVLIMIVNFDFIFGENIERNWLRFIYVLLLNCG